MFDLNSNIKNKYSQVLLLSDINFFIVVLVYHNCIRVDSKFNSYRTTQKYNVIVHHTLLNSIFWNKTILGLYNIHNVWKWVTKIKRFP